MSLARPLESCHCAELAGEDKTSQLGTASSVRPEVLAPAELQTSGLNSQVKTIMIRGCSSCFSQLAALQCELDRDMVMGSYLLILLATASRRAAVRDIGRTSAVGCAASLHSAGWIQWMQKLPLQNSSCQFC